MPNPPTDWTGAAYDSDPDEVPDQRPVTHRFATEGELVDWVACA